MAGEQSTTQLKDLADSGPGAIAIGPFGSKMKADVYTEKGMPIIRGTNISDGRGWKGDWVYIPEDFAKSMPNCIAKSGDLVFPHRGSIGEVAIIPDEPLSYMISSSLMKFRADSKKASSLFLYYYFRSQSGKNEILKYSSSVGTPGIGQPLTSLKKFRVPKLPLKTQHSIAEILSTLDDKIEANRQLNETLEASAKALFKSWFVDFDPVHAKAQGKQPAGLAADIADLFPASFVDSELGPIPNGWEVSTIGQNFNLTMGQSPPGNTYNEEGDGMPFFQGRRDFGFRYPSNRVYCSAPTRFAESGDTLISVRAPVGDINMAHEKCCIGRGVAGLRHNSGSISYTFYTALNLKEHFKRFEADGTVFGSISKSDFEKLPFIKPSKELVELFDETAGCIDKKIEVSSNTISTLTNLRDTLLPKLMSGELRVKDAEAMVQHV